jgi:hypothetical protein
MNKEGKEGTEGEKYKHGRKRNEKEKDNAEPNGEVAADGEPPAKRVCILLLTW